MAELRAGGLAIITQSRIAENVGATVRLMKYMGLMRGHLMDAEFETWEVRSATERHLKGFIPSGIIVSRDIANIPAKWLMPIDGDDFKHEEERQKELSHG